MTHLAPFLIPPAPGTGQSLVVEDALAAVRRHLDMPIAYLSVFEGDDVVFRAVSTDHVPAVLVAGSRRPAEGSYCKAVRDGDLPQLLPDTRVNPFAMAMPVTMTLPVGAMIAIPLNMRDGTTYGMFCCLSHVPLPALNDRDHAVMQTFANLVADVIGIGLSTELLHSAKRRAIEDVIIDRDFQLLFQPIVTLADNSVAGAEALCRFRPTPYRSPDKWFADAREVGMQRELERAVIAKTLDMLSELPMSLKLSINVSPDLLVSCDLAGLIDGPFSDRIVFELTEHENFGSITDLQHQMKRLRRRGAKIAVDDLGAGYASLNTALQIKPDIVKLDREMVRGIYLDPASRALTAGIVHFADAIGAEVIAEGIERQDEVNTLVDLGVRYGQGYLLGRPGSMTALQARTFTC